MSPAELACRCLLKAGVTELPVDAMQLLRLARATFVYTREQALAEGIPADELPPLSPDNPANTLAQIGPEGARRWIVLWQPQADPAQQRFSLAHELGHIALKHASPVRSPADEAEADAFARSLLAPPPLLRLLLRERGALYAEQVRAVFGLTAREARRLSGRRLPGIAPETEKQVAERLGEAAVKRLPERTLTGWHRLILP